MEKKDLPYWVKILSHYESKGYFHNGLTIPFLIGARTILEPHEKLLSIEDLLTESSISITIMKCGNINEYIIGLTDFETENQKQHYKQFGNLLITDSSFDEANDFQAIINTLENIYNECIENGLYSKEGKDWQEFSSLDESRLKEIL